MAVKCLECEVTVIGVVLLANVSRGISDGIHGIIVQLHRFIHYEVPNFLPFVVLVLFLDSRVILAPHPECLDVVDAFLVS